MSSMREGGDIDELLIPRVIWLVNATNRNAVRVRRGEQGLPASSRVSRIGTRALLSSDPGAGVDELQPAANADEGWQAVVDALQATDSQQERSPAPLPDVMAARYLAEGSRLRKKRRSWNRRCSRIRLFGSV